MKKCPKCGKEYQDSDAFCATCGVPLQSFGMCQKCGRPVEPTDAFCKHCGHKIEKEYHCEQCGSVITENAKFCPQCGAEIKNPTVSVPGPTGKNTEFANYIKKILFFAVSGVLFVSLLLMFIGCFGNIAVAKSTISSIDNETITIKYFFGGAFDDLKKEAASLSTNNYSAFVIFTLILEYICWFTAIGSAIAGMVCLGLKVYEAVSAKKYVFKNGVLGTFVLGGLPYVFAFALKEVTVFKIAVKDSGLTYSYLLEAALGWGTTMVFVSTIISFCSLILYNLALSIIDKEDVARNACIASFKILFFFIFVFSFMRVVDLDYSDSGNTLTGHMSVLSIYTDRLYQLSAKTIKTIPEYANECLTGTILLFIGGLIGTASFALLLSNEKNTLNIFKSVVFGTFTLALLIITIIGFYNAYDGMLTGGSSVVLGGTKNMAHYSGMGIALPIIGFISTIGIIVASNITTQKKA